MHPTKVRSEGFPSYRLVVYHRKFKTSIPIFVSIVKEDLTSSSSVALGPCHLIWTSVTFHLEVISPTGSSPLSHAHLCACTVPHSRVFLPTDGSFSFLLPCFFPSTRTLPPHREPLYEPLIPVVKRNTVRATRSRTVQHTRTLLDRYTKALKLHFLRTSRNP